MMISFKPLTHISFRCEVPTPSVGEAQSTIVLKSHILKHQIPELPKDVRGQRAPAVASGASPRLVGAARIVRRTEVCEVARARGRTRLELLARAST